MYTLYTPTCSTSWHIQRCNSIRFSWRIIIQGRTLWPTTWDSLMGNVSRKVDVVMSTQFCNKFPRRHTSRLELASWMNPRVQSNSKLQSRHQNVARVSVCERERQRIRVEIHDGRVVSLFVYQKEIPIHPCQHWNFQKKTDSVDLSSASWIAIIVTVLCVIPKCFLWIICQFLAGR